MTTLKNFRHWDEDQWKEYAKQQADKGSGPITPITAGIIGGLALVPFSLIGSVFVATGCLWWAFERSRVANAYDDQIDEHNCVAPLLDGRELKRFISQAGVDEAIAQIEHAKGEKLPIAPAARKLYRQHRKQQGRKQPVNSAVPELPPAEGNSAVPELPSEAPAIVLPENHPAMQIAALSPEGYLRSWFVCGYPGSGKGTLVAMAQECAKRIHGEGAVRFWAIDPKNDPAELHRWQGIPSDRRYHFDASAPDLDTDQAEADIKALIIRFHGAAKDPAKIDILIVDEMPTIASSLSKSFANFLKNYCSSCASMGRSQNRAVWIVTQAVGVTENGLTTTSKDSFTECYLVAASTAHKLTAHPSYRWNKQVPSALLQDGGRACLTSLAPRTWLAIPKEYKAIVDNLYAEEEDADALTTDDRVELAARSQKNRHAEKQQISLFEQIKSAYGEGDPIRDFLDWINNQKGKKDNLTWDQIRTARWCSEHGRSRDVLDPVILEAERLGILESLDADGREYRILDWE